MPLWACRGPGVLLSSVLAPSTTSPATSRCTATRVEHRGLGHLWAELGSCVCALGLCPRHPYERCKVAAKGRAGPGCSRPFGKQLKPHLQRVPRGVWRGREGWRGIRGCNLSRSRALPMSAGLYLSRCRALLAPGQELVIPCLCAYTYRYICLRGGGRLLQYDPTEPWAPPCPARPLPLGSGMIQFLPPNPLGMAALPGDGQCHGARLDVPPVPSDPSKTPRCLGGRGCFRLSQGLAQAR